VLILVSTLVAGNVGLTGDSWVLSVVFLVGDWGATLPKVSFLGDCTLAPVVVVCLVGDVGLLTGVFVVFPVIGFRFVSNFRPLSFLPVIAVGVATGFNC